jgi:hypothetical protein
MTSEIAAAPEGTAGRVDRENVKWLRVTVTNIQVLAYCEDAGEQNGDGQCEDLWEDLDLGDSPFDLRLDSLPSEDADAIPITAATPIPEGTYHKIRLFVSDAKVAFENPVTVGRSTFEAFDHELVEGDDPTDPALWYTHDVEIPSAQNTGIKADIDIEVTGGDVTEIALLFDADATYRNVIATGNGRVKMPPVLKVRPMNHEQNQNQNGG